MRTSDFDFSIPQELIAQVPAASRESSRLLVVHRQPATVEHRQFPDLLDYLQPDDVLVLNDSRVIPARLRGVNQKSGGQFEILLFEEVGLNDWWVMLRPGKRAREGTRIVLTRHDQSQTLIEAIVIGIDAEGHRRLRFNGVPNILDAAHEIGEVPLPPYIERADRSSMSQDRERYQTVFAHPPGSVAAPTAGLHFTQELLQEIRRRGVKVCFVTLHVGLGTFAPVKSEEVSGHMMHEERYEVSSETAQMIESARAAGGRVVAVGTTTLRVLESVARDASGTIIAASGRTRIFIYPPYEFKVVNVLLTNFHLPRSTLVMLVSAFAAPGEATGRELILKAYAAAIEHRYRFFSYGDAMLLL